MKQLNKFRFRILDDSPEGVVLLNHKKEILYLNNMVAQWAGIQLDEVEGREISEIFPKFGERKYQSRVDQVLKNGFPLILSPQLHPDLLVAAQSSKQKIGQVILSRVPESDVSESMLRISLMDVTSATQQYERIVELQRISTAEIQERKRVEAELVKEHEELQEALAAKDKFFSILAHDLRGPLGGVVSMADSVLSDYDLFDKDEVKELVTMMHRSSEQVFTLLQNLLTWSRLNTGRMDFNPSMLRLKPLVDELVLLFEAQMKKKEIAFSVTCDDHWLVYADEHMLKTVIRNLVSNALKFTPRGGSVKLSVSSGSESEYTTMRIEDTGVGMSEDVLSKVFDVTSKYHTPGTENEASSGLGLVLVKEFVELNKGKLGVTSTPSQGTCFRVDLSNTMRD